MQIIQRLRLIADEGKVLTPTASSNILIAIIVKKQWNGQKSDNLHQKKKRSS